MTQRGVKCFKLNTHLSEAIIFKTVLDRFRPRRIRLRNKNCQQILWHGLFKESTPGSVAVVWPQSLLWRESQGWQDKILRTEQVTDTARLVQSLIYHTFKLSKDLQILKIFTDSEIVYFVNFASSCVQFWCKNLTKSCKISCSYIKFHEDNFISEI